MLGLVVFVLVMALFTSLWLLLPQWLNLAVFLLIVGAVVYPMWELKIIQRAWKFVKE